MKHSLTSRTMVSNRGCRSLERSVGLMPAMPFTPLAQLALFER
jgi:hypothetical protein